MPYNNFWYLSCFVQGMAAKSPYGTTSGGLHLTLELVGDPPPTGERTFAVANEPPAVPDAAVAAGFSNNKLELVVEPLPEGDAPIVIDYASPAGAKPEVAASVAKEARFLVDATREYEAGTVDQMLWARAVAQSNGNESLVLPAYLRARATALRLKRNMGQRRPDGTARPSHPVPDARPAPAVPHAANSPRTARTRRGNANATGRRRIAIAALLGSLVVVAGLLGAYWSGGATAEANSAAAATTVLRLKPAANPVAASKSEDDPSQEFMIRILELKNAGNWNVVILHALAWTRKQPGNADAWRELSLGYANMRQLDDALGAATKAVQLAPSDALLWRNLGQVNMDLNDPVEALRAFDEATRRNDQDAYSFAQAGILNTRLGRLPEAKLAFDKALALNSEDADARCGEMLIAQRLGRSKESASKAVDVRCRDVFDRANAAVVLKGPTAFKVVPVGGS